MILCPFYVPTSAHRRHTHPLDIAEDEDEEGPEEDGDDPGPDQDHHLHHLPRGC